MKKTFVLFLLFAVLTGVFIGCSPNNPASPAATATTVPATSTPENTGTYTMTPTITYTFTFTPTPTFTPPTEVIDDFEDGDIISNVVCADCTNITSVTLNPGAAVLSDGLVYEPGLPFGGTYYYSVTGTTKIDGITAINLNTDTFTDQAGGTGKNYSGALTMRFSYKYSGEAAAKVRVVMYHWTLGLIDVYFNPLNDNTWHDQVIDFTAFSGTPSTVLGSTYITSFSIRTVDTTQPSADMYFEYSVDNIRVTY